jgi:hypothetical protein
MININGIVARFGNIMQVAVITILLIIIPTQAYAAASATCDNFTLNDTNIPTVSECEGQISLTTVFTSSLCLMRAVVAESMFQVYCDLMEGMKEPVQVALTLWIIFYAISVMFGIGNTNGRDVIIRLLKVTAIIAFVTNAEVFYKYLYEFFIHGLLEGISTMLFAMDPSNASPGGGHEAIVNAGDSFQDNEIGIFSYIDELFNIVIGGDRLIALGVLIVAYWYTGVGAIVSLLLMLGVLAMVQAFFRIIITYAVAILALSFILMFAPLFITFAMFKRTSDLFLGWLAAIVSYIVQPIIVLGFVFLFAAVSDISDFIAELQYEDPEAKTGLKIDMDAEHATDLIVMSIRGEMPAFKDLDGTKTGDKPDESFLNNSKPTDGDFAKGVFFALSFLVLNAVMGAFLKRVPQFAQMMGRFQGQFTTPPIAMTPNVGWDKAGSGGSSGIFTPDRFFNGGGNMWKNMEKGTGGGAGAKEFGKMFSNSNKSGTVKR